MRKLASKVTRSGYKNIIKPVLFSRQPDSVHKQMIKTADLLSHIPGMREIPRVWGYQNKGYLEQTVAGITFRNPVGLSAGLDKDIQTPRIMRGVGFGFVTGGSVTWGASPGNEGEWYFRLPKTQSLVVNAGLPSDGTEAVMKRLAQYPEAVFKDFPLVVSVAKTNSRDAVSDEDAIKDYAMSLAMFDGERRVSALEVNISCPNTYGGEPFTTPERLDKLLSVVDSLKLHKPVLIKMPISLPIEEYRALIDVIVTHKVAGVTVGNLRKDRKNIRVKDVFPDTVKGNISGAPNRDISTNLVRDTYRRYGDKLIIIGVGGVFNAEHAYEKIRAGATFIEMVTGVIFEGPQVVGDINAGLVELLKRDGFANISEAIGVDANKD